MKLEPNMIIHGDGFLLRHSKPADIPALVKHANNKNISDNLRDRFPNPYTEKDAEWFINFASANNNPVTNFVIEINSEAAGSISFWRGEDVYRLNAEIGYWLGEEHWGKGIMTNVIRSVTKYIFKNFDIKRIFALPFVTSIGSAKALEKAGFTKEATIHNGVIKNGKVLDYYIYSITSF
jgi:ribosomal-protein-alanine N-acetyltransferase